MVSTRNPNTTPSSYQPWATSSAVRRVMQGNRKRETRPELLVRSAAHRLGLRYRVAARPLPGRQWTADLVFPAAKLAVFVDGCYWHACPTHFKPPRTNQWYWGPKIERNRARATQVDTDLKGAGWEPLHVWEHEPPSLAAARIAAAVRRRRQGG